MADQDVALVTGCSKGTMGEGIAEALAKKGCKLACVEHPARLAECELMAQRLMKEYGVECCALAADATDPVQVEASFQAAARQLGAEVNIVVSTIGGGGVDVKTGGLRNGGTHLDGTPRVERSWEESWSVRIPVGTAVTACLTPQVPFFFRRRCSARVLRCCLMPCVSPVCW